MSKTFKNRVSVRDAESVLEITDTPAGIRITVSEEDRIVSGWLNPDQGAEIALAILEAAGYDDKADDMSQADAHAFDAMHKLQQSVDEQERAAAEAKEQAELEAEALELMNVRLDAAGNPKHLTKETVDPIALEAWIAVARRAREMRAEK